MKPNNLILSNVSRARQPAWTHPRLCSDVSGERLRTVEFATEFAGPLNGDGGITPWTTTSPVLTQESASQEHISFAIELYGSYDPVETPKPLWAFRGAEDVVLNTSTPGEHVLQGPLRQAKFTAPSRNPSPSPSPNRLARGGSGSRPDEHAGTPKRSRKRTMIYVTNMQGGPLIR